MCMVCIGSVSVCVRAMYCSLCVMHLLSVGYACVLYVLYACVDNPQ